MRLLSYAYRFVTNFLFLATVYFSLNYVEKYSNRAVLAILVLIYTALRAASAIRSFYFYQCIEKLESEARRFIALITEGGAQSPLRKQTVQDVSLLRRDGEVKSYIDLFFLAAVVLLCVAKIVTDRADVTVTDQHPVAGGGNASAIRGMAFGKWIRKITATLRALSLA